jgi:HD-like signal output (HDOD) protein
MEMDNQDNSKKKKILFVDDEPNVLNGLERMLRPMRHVWTVTFAATSQKALEILKGSHFDVVVTDIRMPVMNGLQLLSEVKRLYPDTVRIILSGESDRELTMKAVNVSHQFLNKPCDTEILKDAISRIGELSSLLQKESIKAMVSKVDSLPSLPSLYVEIMKELQSDNSSIRKIGDIISRDLAMTAKILQLVNSSYFSLPRHISSPEQAVFLLGLDTIRSLVLSIQVFSQFKLKKISQHYLTRLWDHSMRTAGSSKKVAIQERQDQVVIDNSFMSGLLHDSGKLVMASCFGDEYAEIIAMNEGVRSLTEKEREMFDVTHAEAGAYLMGLWGLPHTIIEAIAYHHSPGRSHTKQFTPLTAVYIANMLEYEKSGYFMDKSEIGIDHEYLSEMRLKADYPFWDMPGQEMREEMRAYEQ